MKCHSRQAGQEKKEFLQMTGIKITLITNLDDLAVIINALHTFDIASSDRGRLTLT